LQEYQGKSDRELAGIVVTIAKNLTINKYNRQNKIEFIPLSETDSSEDYSDEVGDFVIKEELHEQLYQAVNRLDEVYARVVKLKLGSDYSNKQIGEILDISDKILKRGKRFKADIQKSSLKILKKSAIIVLVVLSLSFVSLLTVESVRTEIYNVITTFYGKYIDVRFANTNNQDAAPEKIEHIYLPSYVPDGYVEVGILKSDYNIKAIYMNSGDNILFYSQDLLSAAIGVDGEDYTESDITINGKNGKIYEYNKPDGIFFTIIWHDNKYSYSLTGHSSREEVVKIAESVRRKNTEK